MKILASKQDHLDLVKQFQIPNSGTKKMEQANSTIFCLNACQYFQRLNIYIGCYVHFSFLL